MHGRSLLISLLAVAILLTACGGTSLAEHHYNAAVLLQAHGHHQQAVGEYGKAIGAFRERDASDPRYVYAYVNRAIAYRNLGLLPELGRDIARAVEVDPELAKAFIRRSVVYTIIAGPSGGYNRRTAFGSTKANASPFYNREGVNFLHQNRLVRSMADLNRAIALDPGNALAWSNRAALHLIIDEPHKALDDATEAIRLRPTVAKSHANRALINTILRNNEASKQDAQNALDLGLDPTRLRVGMGMLKLIR